MGNHDPQLLHTLQERSKIWARELIDLNPRSNTLLSFVPGRGTQINLSEAEPEALAKMLSGQKTHLSSLFPNGEQRSQTAKQMRLLRLRANQIEEEQGFEATRMAFGLLRTATTGGRPSSSSGAPALRSPLLLAPLVLGQASAASTDFTFEIGEEIEPNPVLLHVVSRVLGVNFDVLAMEQHLRNEISSIADRDERLTYVYRTIADLAAQADVKTSLETVIAVGLFNYDKYPMVRDLQDSIELLTKNPVVAALAGHGPAKDELAVADTSPLPIGNSLNPDEEHLVLDADSSQQQAINAALHGRNAVIVGPPGTGKSQTIANIIAGAAAQGRRVLFVAEKRAAIEAVTDRLASVDLDGLVFDLHHQQVKRKDVAQQLAATLERAGRERAPDTARLHQQLIQARERANAHANLMNTAVSPWNLSPYEVQERLLGIPEDLTEGIRLRPPVLDRIYGNIYDEVVDDLRMYIHQGGLRIRRKESPWATAKVHSQEDVRAILKELDDVQGGQLRASQNDLDEILLKTGLSRPETLAQWRDLLSLLDQIGHTTEEFGTDAFSADLDARVSASAPWGSRERAQIRLNPFERWQIRRAARISSSSKLRSRALHTALLRAREQREAWLKLSNEATAPHEVEKLGAIMQRFRTVRDSLIAVAACLQIQDLDSRTTSDVGGTFKELHDDRNTFKKILVINQTSNRMESRGLSAFLDLLAEKEKALGDDLVAQSAVDVLESLWLTSLEEEYCLQIPQFRDFAGRRHSEVVDDFRTSDVEHLKMNRQRIRRKVAERLREAQNAHPDQSQLVKREASKKSRHRPLRELVEKAPDVLLSAHPCWAMSPLVVSKMLPAQQLFDLIIFDEASQVEPHDAVTSIMRGRQLVIAGDPKQLPPNRLFRFTASEETLDEDDEDDLAQYESILDVLTPVLPKSLLRWHYRSQDERLIAFSNREIYGGELVTFAGCSVDSPLSLNVVNGVAEPGQNGVASAEITEVIQLVHQHVEFHPRDSLGIITFSSKQADAMEARLRTEQHENPELAAFVAHNDRPGRSLFVKNLERVQGDERDAIILSVGRPKTATGRVSLQFGTLGHEGGERRLNVAITRAKERMSVVSSFAAHEMAPKATKNHGPELLRQFLEFAGSNHHLGRIGQQRNGIQLNGFERSVQTALNAAGLDIHPQWGIGEYSIDFAVAHPDRPGQMVLAVEADGERYHRSQNARDRDRLRQSHLEALGWRFIRIWSTDWFREPDLETARVVDAWHRAVQDLEHAESAEPTPVENPTLDEEVPRIDRGPRPNVVQRGSIDAYPTNELVDLFSWLLGDGLLLEREERIAEAMTELGFKRLGPRIRRALTDAFDSAARINLKDMT